jgi:ribosomal protein S18 acetylase RimI-like enzyme
MKNIICLHDKNQVETFFRQNTFLHLYEIGDLDDFFWHHTTWYALTDRQQIKQIALLYTSGSLPVLLALTEASLDSMQELLRAIIYLLPKQFYAHLSKDLVTVFADECQIKSHGTYYKMALTNSFYLNTFDTSDVIPLSVANITEVEHLYRLSYPDNWFESRMLETGDYFGIKQYKNLVSVAGVHVYSPQYKVAALGNITTHPQFRGRGLAKVVCAKLCQELLQTVTHIGLNVKVDNASAIACYSQLGFEPIATYEEYSLELKT